MPRESKEDSLARAVELYNDGFGSYKKCAEQFNVKITTLKRRVQGAKAKRLAHEKQQALSEAEERSIVNWIKKLTSWGFSPRVDMVMERAMWLYSQRDIIRVTSANTFTVGPHEESYLSRSWFTRFKKRNPELVTTFSRRLESSRAAHNNPEHVQSFFQLYQSTVAKYNVKPQNVWNMDEKGYMIGVSASSKIVTIIRGRGINRNVNHSGNKELVTTIECVSATGQFITPMIIYKGKVHTKGMMDSTTGEQYQGWTFVTSPSGWTDNDASVLWLRHNFVPQTQPSDKAEYRILILDGQISHHSQDFIDHCERNKILALCLPAHSTHLLQPLDVGVF